MEYRSVLCVTGDTASLGPAEVEAARVARLCGCRLILLHVVEKWRSSVLIATDSPEWKSILDSWLDDAKELLGRKEELLRAGGAFSIKKEARIGEKAAEALLVAAEQDVSLIVLPICHGWIKSLVASSFTSEMITNSPCPILWVSE